MIKRQHLSVNQKWPNYGLDVLNITHAYRSGNTFNECLCVVLGEKPVAHLMKFHLLQWELAKENS